ncbi:serine/arginine repetitive matrix protein 1-like [Gorilla gorilla gorilla]|uniref:serine/arginine repetitive matrix protein 1-like n=1 Tax=Gorilla gorilla gorilla TaxID=9595 RepID=UPI003008096C
MGEKIPLKKKNLMEKYPNQLLSKTFLPVCNHRSSPDSQSEPRAKTPSRAGRFLGPPARRRCGPVSGGHRSPRAQHPNPHGRAQPSPAPRRSSEFCAARRGYSRSFHGTTSAQLPDLRPGRSCPERPAATVLADLQPEGFLASSGPSEQRSARCRTCNSPHPAAAPSARPGTPDPSEPGVLRPGLHAQRCSRVSTAGRAPSAAAQSPGVTRARTRTSSPHLTPPPVPSELQVVGMWGSGSKSPKPSASRSLLGLETKQ